MSRPLKVLKSWCSAWLTAEIIMHLTRKEKCRSQVDRPFDQLVWSGQRHSLRVIPGSEGASHPNTLLFFLL